MRIPLILEYVDGQPVSPDLRPLLSAIYAEVQRNPTDLAELRTALRRLLDYLCSAPGRTNANCCAADSFFMHDDRWERDWEHLPPPYQGLLGDLGGALHDTVAEPAIAENFDSTPEQFLARLDRLTPDTQF
jgi:hypothetical protein